MKIDVQLIFLIFRPFVAKNGRFISIIFFPASAIDEIPVGLVTEKRRF
jgi:hypothetical protein